MRSCKRKCALVEIQIQKLIEIDAEPQASKSRDTATWRPARYRCASNLKCFCIKVRSEATV